MISQSAEAGLQPHAKCERPAHVNARKHQQRVRVALFLTDFVLINIAFTVGFVMRYQWQWFRDISFAATLTEYLPLQIIFNLALLVFFWLDGVYALRRSPAWLDQIWTIAGGIFKAIFVVWVAIFIYGPAVYSRLMMLQAGAVLLVLMGISRLIRAWYDAHQRKKGVGVANVIIVGAGELGRAVMRTLFARPELGYRCAGFVDDDPYRGRTDIGRFAALGEVSALPELLRRHEIDEVVITLPWSAQPKIMEVIEQCDDFGAKARVVPSLLQMNLSRIDVNDFGGIPMLSAHNGDIGPFNRIFKRIIDIVFGAIFAALGLPFIAIAAIAIRMESPGPVIFSQLRAGKDGKPFKVYKLRSMFKDADQMKEQLKDMNEVEGPMFKIREDPRRTKVGRFIRKSSIDELPQFWNVLKGEMSIVGPRPALLEEVAQYDEWHYERLRVKPGITGLWQISGRSELTFDEMVLLDVYYIESWSPSLDFKIMLRTPPYMLSGKGAY